MRLKTWKVALAAMGMVGLIGTASWAQEEESSPCEEACYQAEDRCYEKCQDPDDDGACEHQCQEESNSCVERCGG
jgi:hypothetical protein